MVALMLSLAALYQWGLPVLAQGVVALTPHSVDVTIGQSTLAAVDEALMQASELPLAQQDVVRKAFRRHSRPVQESSAEFQFRKSKIGPNALALPGGTILDDR